MKSPNQRSLAIFGAIIGLATIFYAHSAIAAQFYSIAGGSSGTVNEWSDCRRVINASGQATIFIPTNTSSEWSEFRIHYPSGISLAACDWIPNYSYRKKITISAGSARTNYQIKLITDTATLVSAGKMQSDCDDMRFGDTSGNVLDYWLESGCNTGSTVAWVEIPSLASGTSYIYMYYGNGSVSAASNGSATFPLFDNFDDGNLTGWSTGQDNYNYTSESTSVVVNTENVSAPYSIRLYTYSSCYSSPYNGIIAWAQMAINPPSGTYVADAVSKGSGGQHHYCTGGTASTNSILVDGTIVYNSPACAYSSCNSCSVGWTAGTSSSFAFSGAARTIRIRNLSGDCEYGYGWFDNVRVRAYMSPEPTTSFGGEES